ncbi:hypothetical protein A2U01_0061421, partial [Trifolium medium]|nr:hypothetical protein [Trifolium medium]
TGNFGAIEAKFWSMFIVVRRWCSLTLQLASCYCLILDDEYHFHSLAVALLCSCK